MKTIMVDIDGVLAKFDEPYQRLLIETSGKDLFGPNFVAREWDYDLAAGYTKREIDRAWRAIDNTGGMFWYDLLALSGAEDTLMELCRLESRNDIRVFFVTARTDKGNVRRWSRGWLFDNGWASEPFPTVLFTKQKGILCRALGVTHAIDDRWENAVDIAHHCPEATVCLMDASYNAEAPLSRPNMRRVTNLQEFMDEVTR